MEKQTAQFIFPQLERTLFVKGKYIFVPLELIIHGVLIAISLENQNLDGIWFSLFLALIFGFVHIQNLRFRKYCLAKWFFDGTAFRVYIKGEKRSVDISQTFCVSATTLSFARRYSSKNYPFVMIFKPGVCVPYEEMNGYKALKTPEVLIIPFDEETQRLFNDSLHIADIPKWPKSRVIPGVAQK